MLGYRYLQIQKNDDGYGYIECDSYLSGKVEAENMIPVPEDFEATNKRWNYFLQGWEMYEPEPEPELQPTQADRIEESQLVIMEAMAEQYEQHQAERLTDMEVKATTYEAILALQKGGKV